MSRFGEHPEGGVGLLDHDVRETLGSVTKPALILAGSRDVLTPVRAARSIAKLLPDATFRVFPEAGHQLMQERPDEVAEELRALAERVDADEAEAPATARAGTG